MPADLTLRISDSGQDLIFINLNVAYAIQRYKILRISPNISQEEKNAVYIINGQSCLCDKKYLLTIIAVTFASSQKKANIFKRFRELNRTKCHLSKTLNVHLPTEFTVTQKLFKS